MSFFPFYLPRHFSTWMIRMCILHLLTSTLHYKVLEEPHWTLTWQKHVEFLSAIFYTLERKRHFEHSGCWESQCERVLPPRDTISCFWGLSGQQGIRKAGPLLAMCAHWNSKKMEMIALNYYQDHIRNVLLETKWVLEYEVYSQS